MEHSHNSMDFMKLESFTAGEIVYPVIYENDESSGISTTPSKAKYWHETDSEQVL